MKILKLVKALQLTLTIYGSSITPKALSDLNDWQKSGNTGIKKKITELRQSIRETLFEGIVKPEKLKHELSGKWSRRINHEHRIVYSIDSEKIKIYSLKGHY